jgi:DNA-binding winged helix-turn-helix (wHTH) protein
MSGSYPEHPMSYRQEIVEPLLTRMQQGESCSVVGSASVAKSNLVRFILRSDVQQHYLGGPRSDSRRESTAQDTPSKAQPMLTVLVDTNDLLEESEWAVYELIIHRLALLFQHHTEDTKISSTLSLLHDTVLESRDRFRAQRYLERAVSLLCKRHNQHLVLLVDEADLFYRMVDVRFLNSLRALRDEHKYRLCYVLFTRTTLDRLRDPTECEAFYELFNRNVLGLKPYQQDDALRVVAQLQVRRDHPLKERKAVQLVYLSGGHPGLLVALFEAVISKESPASANPADWLSIPSIRAECQKLWDGLQPDEQLYLLRLETELADHNTSRAQELLALKGLITTDDKGQPQLFAPLFSHFVKQQDLHDVYDFRVDEATASVRVAGKQITTLTPLEFTLVSLFYQHPGEVQSRDDILKALYPDEFKAGVVPNLQDNRVDTTIKRLRSKVEPMPADPRYILTVRGRGYKLRAPSDSD